MREPIFTGRYSSYSTDFEWVPCKVHNVGEAWYLAKRGVYMGSFRRHNYPEVADDMPPITTNTVCRVLLGVKWLG